MSAVGCIMDKVSSSTFYNSTEKLYVTDEDVGVQTAECIVYFAMGMVVS